MILVTSKTNFRHNTRYYSKLLRIPNATYRIANLLTDVAPVHDAVVAVHAPVPGEVRMVLGRTPPVTVVAYAEERTTDAATVATRKGRKTGAVVFG
jgi:hypothetical protein